MIHRFLTKTIAPTAALAVCASLLISGAAPAQTTKPDNGSATDKPAADLPKATDLLEESFKAMGGRKALGEVESMQSTFDSEQMGQKITINSYWHKDNKARIEQIMGEMTVTIVCNGDIAFADVPMRGYQLLPEDQAKGVRQQAGMQLFVFYETRNDEGEFLEGLETAGVEEFDGKKCFKIKFEPEDEEAANQDGHVVFIDQDTNLPAGMMLTSNDPMMGTQTTNVYFRNWESFGDVKLFTTMVVKQGPNEQTMEYNEVKLNEVDESKFEIPDEVKEMASNPKTPPTPPMPQPGG